MSKRFVDAQWEFRSKFLNSVKEQRPRWKRAVAAAEGAMGEAIGRTYVAEYFPPDSKIKMEKLVADLRTAMKGRIDNLQLSARDRNFHFLLANPSWSPGANQPLLLLFEPFESIRNGCRPLKPSIAELDCCWPAEG